jgi:hypothetical protein
MGLALSLERNQKRFVLCARHAQYLEDPEHHGVLREDVDGNSKELQKELGLVRKRSAICLKTVRDIEALSGEALSPPSTKKIRWRKRGQIQAQACSRLSHKRSGQQLV